MLNTMQHVRDKIGETAEALLSLTLQWKWRPLVTNHLSEWKIIMSLSASDGEELVLQQQCVDVKGRRSPSRADGWAGADEWAGVGQVGRKERVSQVGGTTCAENPVLGRSRQVWEVQGARKRPYSVATWRGYVFILRAIESGSPGSPGLFLKCHEIQQGNVIQHILSVHPLCEGHWLIFLKNNKLHFEYA